MAQEKTQQLSTKMLPRKIKEGEVRKFKLMHAGKIDPYTDLPAFNSGATLEGITTVWDVERQEKVILKNITGKRLSKDKDGKDIVEEIVSPIEFDNNGILYVRHDQPETYVFMARDPRCATNPFRDKSVPEMWYEIIESNIKEKEQFKSNMEYEALKLIKEGDINDILAIGKTLSEKRLVEVNLDGNPTDIRWAIEKVCKINPTEVIRAGKEKLPKIEIDIHEAANYGEIEYQHDGNTWVWTKEYGDGSVIHKITPGHDPVKVLAKILLQEEEDMNKKKREERTPTSLQKIKKTLKELSVESV